MYLSFLLYKTGIIMPTWLLQKLREIMIVYRPIK